MEHVTNTVEFPGYPLLIGYGYRLRVEMKLKQCYVLGILYVSKIFLVLLLSYKTWQRQNDVPRE